MGKFGDHIQEANWKNEKHVPVIECPGSVEADHIFEVKATLGKEIVHPNVGYIFIIVLVNKQIINEVALIISIIIIIILLFFLISDNNVERCYNK